MPKKVILMKKNILLFFLILILISCNKNSDFEKVLIDKNNIWTSYRGDYHGMQKVKLSAKYVFNYDKTFSDLDSPKVPGLGFGSWDYNKDKNIFSFLGHQFIVVNFSNDSIVFIDKMDNSKARFYNRKIIKKLGYNEP